MEGPLCGAWGRPGWAGTALPASCQPLCGAQNLSSRHSDLDVVLIKPLAGSFLSAGLGWPVTSPSSLCTRPQLSPSPVCSKGGSPTPSHKVTKGLFMPFMVCVCVCAGELAGAPEQLYFLSSGLSLFTHPPSDKGRLLSSPTSGPFQTLPCVGPAAPLLPQKETIWALFLGLVRSFCYDFPLGSPRQCNLSPGCPRRGAAAASDLGSLWAAAKHSARLGRIRFQPALLCRPHPVEIGEQQLPSGFHSGRGESQVLLRTAIKRPFWHAKTSRLLLSGLGALAIASVGQRSTLISQVSSPHGCLEGL